MKHGNWYLPMVIYLLFSVYSLSLRLVLLCFRNDPSLSLSASLLTDHEAADPRKPPFSIFHISYEATNGGDSINTAFAAFSLLYSELSLSLLASPLAAPQHKINVCHLSTTCKDSSTIAVLILAA